MVAGARLLTSRLKRDLVEDRGLDGGERTSLTRRPGQHHRGSALDSSLDEADGKLRSKGGHRPDPGLPGSRIEKAERLEVMSGRVDIPLRALTIDIKVA